MLKKSILILLMGLVSPAVADDFPIANHRFACSDQQYPFTIEQFMTIGLSNKALKRWYRGNDGLYYVEAEEGIQLRRFGFHPHGSIAVMRKMYGLDITGGGHRDYDRITMLIMCNQIGADITKRLGEISAGGGVKSDDYER